MGIHVIIFDLGNTLVYEDRGKSLEKVSLDIALRYSIDEPPAYTTVYRLLGMRQTDFCEASLDAVAYYYASLLGRGRVDIAAARMIREELIRALALSLKPYPATRKVLDELKELGYKIALISNASSQEAIEETLRRLGLIDYFDAVVTSRLVGVRKPDPRIFAYTLTLLQAKPSEAVHVGDRAYEDVLGAKLAGLHAVHLATSEPPSPIADKAVKRLEDIPGTIKELSPRGPTTSH